MIKEFQVGGKKVSIKYYLNSSARPKTRIRNSKDEDHFPLYFELVFNKKINRRSSLFYRFQKQLSGAHAKPYYFLDHFISQFSFDDLSKKTDEKKQAFFSELIKIEEFHIHSLLKLTEGWEKDSYSLSNFAEMYDLSTQFAFDFIEKGFIESKLIPEIEKIIDAQTLNPFVYDFNSHKKFLKSDISAKDLFYLLIKLLKISKNEQILEDIRPYMTLLGKIEMFLNPRFNFPEQNINQNQIAITVTSWFSESILPRLTIFLKSIDSSETEFALQILTDVNKQFLGILSEIELLFKKSNKS